MEKVYRIEKYHLKCVSVSEMAEKANTQHSVLSLTSIQFE